MGIWRGAWRTALAVTTGSEHPARRREDAENAKGNRLGPTADSFGRGASSAQKWSWPPPNLAEKQADKDCRTGIPSAAP